MHFEKIFVPDNYTGTAQQAFSSVSKQYEDALKHLEAQKQKYQRFLADQAETIVTARNTLLQFSRNFDVRKAAACTGKHENFYILCGWMTEADTRAFQADISSDEKNLLPGRRRRYQYAGARPEPSAADQAEKPEAFQAL